MRAMMYFLKVKSVVYVKSWKGIKRHDLSYLAKMAMLPKLLNR
jgi:hypothetical protein